MSDYHKFLESKMDFGASQGFKPLFMPDKLFDFQKYCVDWSLRRGRNLLAEDCGLGKSFQELVIAENWVRETNKNVLLLTPLAVTYQMCLEAEKFDIEIKRSHDGKPKGKITVTNYEQLHKFDWKDFEGGVICDEASILKAFDGTRRKEITEFMRKVKYRLLATATAAPNDYIELGTLSEALGNLGFIDMLSRYFKNDNQNIGLRRHYGEAPKWRFKGQAETPFWRWVTSWAIACRKPSDLGFDDKDFILPELTENHYVIKDIKPSNGYLFNLPATKLDTQREELRHTLKERCEKVAELVNDTNDFAFVGCHLNPEGKLLREMIPDSIEISGSDSDEKKEEKFLAFVNGEARVLITKPKIGAWGLNFQHCNHIVYFPSHSYEQMYQFIRRCWRFGQKRKVRVDMVLTEGLMRVLENLNRKARQADKMFSSLVREMQNSISHKKIDRHTKREEVPSWL